jgi:hypothetical protein
VVLKLNDAEKKALYNAAWHLWGADSQIDMLIEEMSELIQALLKARRYGTVFSHDVFDEIADVTICLDQIETRMRELRFSESAGVLWDQVELIKLAKLKRLNERVIHEMVK